MFLHTDRSSTAVPPRVMALYSELAAMDGGESLLCDGRAVCDELQSHYPKEFAALRSPDSAIFGGPDSSFRSAVISDTSDGAVLRFRYDNLGFYNRQVIEALPTFLNLLEENTLRFKLAEGQALVVDNQRWLHGREAFSGHRIVWRALLSDLHVSHIRDLESKESA